MAAGRERRTSVVGPEHDGKTIQRHLHDALGLSHAVARGLVDGGHVQRNGRPVLQSDTRLLPGDRIEVTYEPGRRYRPAPRALAGPGFRVLHEDASLVVVDKEPGVITVPAPSHRGTSLQERLEEGWRRRGLRAASALPVHRIDRYTSGLVVFARTRAAWSELRAQFARGGPTRVYLAVAEGRMAADRGRLVHELGEHARSLKVHVTVPGSGGRRAASVYRVVERLPHATFLEVRLETGRRNQIRVQLAAEGHPLVGDAAYGRRSPLVDRTALHAHRLSFVHPADGRTLTFRADLPADLRRLLRRLREGADPREGAETDPREP